MKVEMALTFLLALACSMADASAVMSVQGKVFSITSDEFVILSGLDLIHVRKTSLSPEQRKQLETASTRQITIELPMESVTRVRPGPQRKK